jgi:hypothetical protein
VQLLGGRIEGSAGVGLDLWVSAQGPTCVSAARPVVVTGGRAHPEGMTGNAEDRVMVGAYKSAGSCGRVGTQVLGPALEWHLTTGGGPKWDLLRLEPGARVILSTGDFDELPLNRFEAMGAPDAPIRIESGLSRVRVGGEATLRHVEFSGGQTIAEGVLDLEDTLLQGAATFTVAGPASRLTGITARGSRVVLEGAGTQVVRPRWSTPRSTVSKSRRPTSASSDAWCAARRRMASWCGPARLWSSGRATSSRTAASPCGTWAGPWSTPAATGGAIPRGLWVQRAVGFRAMWTTASPWPRPYPSTRGHRHGKRAHRTWPPPGIEIGGAPRAIRASRDA